MRKKILVWTDFVCPFCYIADRGFSQARAELGLDADLEIRSFELNPELDPKRRQSYLDYLKEYGESKEDIESSIRETVDYAAASGVKLDYDGLPIVNTHDAHRLKVYAEQKGRGEAFYARVQRAYFAEHQWISDASVLTALASEVGLDPDEAARILASDRYADAVREQHRAAVEMDIPFIPYFVFPSGRTAEGRLSREDLKLILQEEFSL